MSRKKKIFYGSLVALLVVAMVGYFVANSVLDRMSRRAMLQLAREAEQRGVQVSHPSFGSVRLSGFLSATWSDVRADVKLQTGNVKQKETGKAKGNGRVWEMQVDRITVDWDIGDQASLVAHGITLIGTPSDTREQKIPDRRIEMERVGSQFPLDLLHPNSSLQKLLPEFVRLSADGTIGLPLEIVGKVKFSIKNQPIELHLQVEQQGDEFSIVLKREDVVSLSALFEEKLTDAEVDLIASHPRRAPRLLDIKDTAESTSASASQEDTSVPQDAYRHILWSYLLTQTYGAEFAEQVGDAHETGDTGNTSAERQMDLHNNALGRKYAEEGILRKEVLNHLLSDPKVRHSP